MTFNFLGPGLTVNVEAKVKEQIILDSSGVLCMIVHEELLLISFDCSSKKHIWSHPRGLTPQRLYLRSSSGVSQILCLP